MSQDSGEKQQQNLEGSFVETAFSNDEVTQAIASEKQRGIRDGGCTFVGTAVDVNSKNSQDDAGS